MTATVAISIVRWVIILFALGSKSWSFNVIISISGLCSLFLFLFNVVVFSLDGGFFFGCVEGGGILFDRLFFFDIIVENFAGIRELNDWFVVGNYTSRAGTLTP